MNQPHRAKKSLGQNFLKDGKTLDVIVAAVLPDVPVLEIGPGKGALTKKLLAAGHQVVAVEKDDRLIAPLQTEFAPQIVSGQFRLVHGDALTDTPNKILGGPTTQFQVVANLPYYITGLYIRQTLESEYQPKQMILLLQEEVVDRIVATDGKESILSISVKIYGEARKLCRVGRKHFSPTPKVDSAVLRISDISKQNFTNGDIKETDFFQIVRQGFSSKRKTLANNLKQYDNVKTVITELGLDEKIRPERLTVPDWMKLTRELS